MRVWSQDTFVSDSMLSSVIVVTRMRLLIIKKLLQNLDSVFRPEESRVPRHVDSPKRGETYYMPIAQ